MILILPSKYIDDVKETEIVQQLASKHKTNDIAKGIIKSIGPMNKMMNYSPSPIFMEVQHEPQTSWESVMPNEYTSTDWKHVACDLDHKSELPVKMEAIKVLIGISK